jgi:hypothetical protein
MRRLVTVVWFFARSLAVVDQTNMPKPACDFSLSREDRMQLAERAVPAEVSGEAALAGEKIFADNLKAVEPVR